MKTLLTALFSIVLSSIVFSQDIKTKEELKNELLKRYGNIDYGDKYYELYENCSTNNSVDSCWKIALWWDYDENDPSKVYTSDMHFYYFSDVENNCGDVTFYLLKPKDATNGRMWIYKDENIEIKAIMIQVETFFGYQLKDIRITNFKNNPCSGPKTCYVKP